MDAKQFLSEFGHVAHAPGGVARLRELIYQLAVTGRLTKQDEKDSDADEVLNNVARIRQQLIAGKKYKRSPKLESSNLVPPAIDLPLNWRWSRLLDLGEINPRNQAEETAMATFVPMAGVSEKHSKEISGEIKPWSKIHKGYTHFANGDVLLAKITPCFENGKAAVVSGLEHDIGAGSTEFHVFRSISQFIHPGYVYLFLRSPLFRAKGEASMTGTAGQKRLPTDYFALCAMPLPPTAEQSRIVAKVDELMALCDKLEVQQQARRKLQNALRQSTLQAVANAASPHELQSTWARLADNFGQLFHAPEDLDELRKAVLDLAVSGYLSNLGQFDEPSSTLKAKILTAKERGILDGSFSRKKYVKPEKLEETLLPAHWECITLDEAISTIDAGWSPACLPKPRDDENKWAVLKTTAVQVLRFLPHEHKELPASLDPRPQYQIEVGDILITRAGPRNRVGICCVADKAPAKLMISDKLIRFHIVDDLINPRFVAVCLSAGESGRTLERLKSGMAESQMNISQDKLRSITIPLPPIEEQRRILEKIELLMKIIDSYSERLRKKNRLAEQAAAASVSSITGIAIEQEEEPMKAPQTELIAPLRLGTVPDIKAQAPLATILARHHGEMSAKDLWQRFGGEIDAFYTQLKTEVAHGWIKEPAPAEVREKPAKMASA
ncbi:TPA: restriction endonuclease subunit S [Serratia marcescens]